VGAWTRRHWAARPTALLLATSVHEVLAEPWLTLRSKAVAVVRSQYSLPTRDRSEATRPNPRCSYRPIPGARVSGGQRGASLSLRWPTGLPRSDSRAPCCGWSGPRSRREGGEHGQRPDARDIARGGLAPARGRGDRQFSSTGVRPGTFDNECDVRSRRASRPARAGNVIETTPLSGEFGSGCFYAKALARW
jgi:hypothetical protein